MAEAGERMSPLEVVAKAIIEGEPHPEWEPPAQWSYIKSVPDHPLYEMGMRQARAALLALSACDLPESVTTCSCFAPDFKVVILAIANGAK